MWQQIDDRIIQISKKAEVYLWDLIRIYVSVPDESEMF